MKLRLFHTALLMSFLFAGDYLQAQDLPIVIQGVLKSSEGTALPDGTYTFTFRLYASNEGDAQPIWSETQSNMLLKDGIYSAVLGSVNPIRLPFDVPYFLGVSLGDGQEFIPRSELTAAPAALFASRGGGGAEPGMIAPFAGYLTKIPYGWFPCDGRALKSVDYPALFAIIGTTYGNGSSGAGAGGGTDFNLPNLNGQFIRGANEGRFGSGHTVGTVQEFSTAAPNNQLNIGSTSSSGQHSHPTISVSHILHSNTSKPFGHSSSVNLVGYTPTTESDGSHFHTGTLLGGDTETHPRYRALIYCIKF
jgi:microcystin-dependent protein